MKQIFLTFFFVCFSLFQLNAQQYQFKKYKVEEGLVSNETFDMLQDSKNRIWISTTGGISCFNGSAFKNYTIEDGLASNISFSIFEDSKERIWVGTLNNGVSIIEDEKITSPTGVDFNFLGSATKFLEGTDGTIYIFFLKGIVVYKNGRLEYLIKKDEENDFLSFQSADWFDSNTIYIASAERGIYKLTLAPLKLENIYNAQNGVNNICYTVLVDGKKNIWVGGYGELNKISNGKLTVYKFDPADFDENRVHGILEENENELYLSFEGNGFGIFNKQTGKLKIIDEKNGLPSKYTYEMIKDSEGKHWMTSYGEGIIRFRDTSFKIYDDAQGLPSKIVDGFVDWNGKWIVDTEARLVAFNSEKQIPPITNALSIKNIIIRPQNNLQYSADVKVLELSSVDAAPKLIDEG